MIKKAKNDTSSVTFKGVGEREDIVVHEIGDASFSPGDKAVGQ